jgi:hypothetical protein
MLLFSAWCRLEKLSFEAMSLTNKFQCHTFLSAVSDPLYLLAVAGRDNNSLSSITPGGASPPKEVFFLFFLIYLFISSFLFCFILFTSLCLHADSFAYHCTNLNYIAYHAYFTVDTTH